MLTRSQMSREALLVSRPKSDYLELQCDCIKANSKWNPISGFNGKSKKNKGFLSGCLLFIFVLLCCLCLVWLLHQVISSKQAPFYSKNLKLVSVLSRHGDRAPSENVPEVDRHREKTIEFFWPNGLENLTDLGKFRSFRLGLKLRDLYDGFIGYQSDEFLAFSSTKFRCIESANHMLRGLFDMETSKDEGRYKIMQLESNVDQCPINKGCRLSSGSGSPEEYLKIELNHDLIPSLTDHFITDSCKYHKMNPSQLDSEAKLDADIRSLPGIDELERVLRNRYGYLNLNISMLSIYSTVACELGLARTKETIQYTDHYADWIGKVVVSGEDYNITLYDILEQAVVYFNRDRFTGVANLINIGQLMNSLIESQTMAVGFSGSNISGSKLNKLMHYRDKKMILYVSHDSKLQKFLQALNVIRFNVNESYEKRYSNWVQRGRDNFDKFINGLSMSSYGMSIKFELWEIIRSEDIDDDKDKDTKIKYYYVTLEIYNQEECKHQDVEFFKVPLGESCRQLFIEKYPNHHQQVSALDAFYDDLRFPIDKSLVCPFDLFKNVTADMIIEEETFNKLC